MRLSPLFMLVPLGALVAGWSFLWTNQRAQMERDLRPWLPEGVHYRISGFPYRLELETGPLAIRREDRVFVTEFSADRVVVGRQMWQPRRHVFHVTAPRLSVRAKGVPGLGFTVAAPVGAASLFAENGQIGRLSASWSGARLSAAFLPQPATADTFEFHVRDVVPVDSAPDTRDPRDPVRGEVVMAGEGVRFGAGDPVTLAASLDLTSAAQIRAFAGWADGGTAELRRLTLSDSAGEVATAEGTIAMTPAGLRLAGVVETRCPVMLRAAVAMERAPAEKRLRRPLAIALSWNGEGGFALAPPTAREGHLPVYGQRPDCPRIF